MLKLSLNTLYVKWLILSLSIVLVIVIVWNTYSFFVYFKAEERLKMELLAESQKSFATDNYFDLINFINTNNKTVPVILVDDKGNILSSNNIDERIENDSVALYEYMQTLKSTNKPIKIKDGVDKKYFLRILYLI
jgi:hypothetical protein